MIVASMHSSLEDVRGALNTHPRTQETHWKTVPDHGQIARSRHVGHMQHVEEVEASCTTLAFCTQADVASSCGLGIRITGRAGQAVARDGSEWSMEAGSQARVVLTTRGRLNMLLFATLEEGQM
eukprot:gnl/TRDRNA2_/TRDRNA2_174911_c3_seq3.p1 gnl/TRDRNA2_/TRDRNA2_174911_c3~~gnl/TRDRNA2_/TRDRNA2_174911_c3_seq3.p1  ORF type:complete len:124 (-),score=19.49 gnl/TRDRNA2_/TRDRNA2_174911_c3_seq3:299-670(-)